MDNELDDILYEENKGGDGKSNIMPFDSSARRVPDAMSTQRLLGAGDALNGAMDDAENTESVMYEISEAIASIGSRPDRIARDVAIMGDGCAEYLLEKYRMSPEELLSIVKRDGFAAKVSEIRADLSTDSHGTSRARAASYLADGVHVARDIFNSCMAKDADRIKALNFIAEMAGVRTSGGASIGAKTTDGLRVELNFGVSHPRVGDLRGVALGGGSDDAS